MTCAGNPAKRWLQSCDAAKMSGDTNTPSRIAAHVHWGPADSKDRRGPPTAAAGGASQVKGIAGSSVDQVVGLIRESQLWSIRLAQNDSASGPETFYNRGVGAWNKLAAACCSTRTDNTRGVEGILDGEWNPVKWSQTITARQRVVGFSCCFQRAV